MSHLTEQNTKHHENENTFHFHCHFLTKPTIKMNKFSSLLKHLCRTAATMTALLLLLLSLSFISTVEGFSSSIKTQVVGASQIVVPRAIITTTPLLRQQIKSNNLPTKLNNLQQRQRLSTYLTAVEPNNSDDSILETNNSDFQQIQIYTPLNRPLLAVVDTISLIIFAAIGKSSHSANGDLDLYAVLMTAFPFVTAWLTTSPITRVYSPDDTSNESNVLVSTGKMVVKGWAVAVPLGIALRGAIKGYVPPTPFIIVTLISTLVILVGVRVLFAVVEDVFVEMVN